MNRKRNGILIVVLCVLLMLPQESFAAGSQSGQYYPPSGSDYYKKKFSWELYFGPDIHKVEFSQYLYPSNAHKITFDWEVTPNSKQWIDFTCKGNVAISFYDANGNRVNSITRGATTSYINTDDSSCGMWGVEKSEYVVAANRYASDTFGGSKNPIDAPIPGSGGNDPGGGGTDPDPGGGGTDPDPGGGDPGGGTDPGDDYDYPKWCDPECRIFECPQWHNYMGKLDDIRNAIPPPPNWDQVAQTFRDTIVPRLISDLGNLLGTAPSIPSTPPALPAINDRGLSNNVPTMPTIPGLDSAGFNANDIKNAAPVIQERQDPTGGFDLIANPLDTLPELPNDSFPKPGETNPGEWGDHQPQEQDNPFPQPVDQGDPISEAPPIPSDNEDTAPMPGDDIGNAPVPGGSGENTNLLDYKKSPEAADGSGGSLRP